MLNSETGKVRDTCGRLICVVVGNEIRSSRRGPVEGMIGNGRIHRNFPAGEVVATTSGRYLLDAQSREVLATISDHEIFEAVDGELLATFEGDWLVGVGGAAFLTAL